MLTRNTAISNFSRFITIVFAAYFFIVPTKSFAKTQQVITHKLWVGLTNEELALINKIDALVNAKNYDDALIYLDQNNSPNAGEKPKVFDAMRDIVLWNKYSDAQIDAKKISFSDISRFANDNQFYPNISDVKRNAEKVAVANNISYQASEQYFKSNPAITTSSKLYVLRSKISVLQRISDNDSRKSELKNEIKTLISEIWVKENLSDNEVKDFLDKYQSYLTHDDYVARISRLLWEGKVIDAKQIMTFVDDDHRRLFAAVIELESFPRYMEQIVLSVPRRLRSNELLSYRRALWYKSKGKIDDLIELVIDLPRTSENPEQWWSMRNLYAREMLKRKEYKLAYLLTARHSLPVKSSTFWEAEWFSGWVALRFLNEPKEAYKHFDNLYRNVTQPVTLSRGAYWLGMASLAMGDKDKAIDWYKVGAQYPTFFYGQLSINKHRVLDSIKARDDIILPKDPEIVSKDMKDISESRAARVAYLLAITGDKTNSSKIFEYVVNHATTQGQIAVIMKIVNELGDRQLDAKISRIAAKKNVFFIKDKFQIVEEVESDQYAPLVHAIIKQESGFAPTAVSQVGAIGFMQLMPATAKLVAKDVGVSYDKYKLATDIRYNVLLGTSYIKTLIDRFEGSEILAVASYNAGPNSTQRWINEFYDPRKEKDIDRVVDWIELITYSETRNYVQRIMENLIVYKYLMSRANYDALD
ncbi:MAG: lytic transglycosylase domain-containing protein [Rickettsiales bacterium]|nr:lytic transglycosylase domain-containing protein [Rickettsiales bacterium]